MDGETKQIFRIPNTARLNEVNHSVEVEHGLSLDTFFGAQVVEARKMCLQSNCQLVGKIEDDNANYQHFNPEVHDILDLTEYVGCIACEGCNLGNQVGLPRSLSEQMSTILNRA